MSPSYFGELVRERTVIASGDFHAACAGAVENQLPTVQLPRPHWQFTELHRGCTACVNRMDLTMQNFRLVSVGKISITSSELPDRLAPLGFEL